MDTSKVKTHITSARKELQVLVDQCVKDRNFGSKSPLRGYASVDTWLTECETKLDNPVKTREKKVKAAKK